MIILLKGTQYLILILFLLSSAIAQVPTAQKLDKNMSLKEVEVEGIAWYDPKEEPFELTGFEWISEDRVYRRLPVNPEWKIREAVDHLANHTAGGQIRFKTNSKRILVRVELRERSGMYHMPATGQSGFDLYMLDSGVQRYLKTTRFPHDTLRYQVELFNVNQEEMRSFTLNFPLYNGVNSVKIGVEEGVALEAPLPFKIPGKIVIYGTSITQGGCVSRPGMAYSNIISRNMDTQLVNLGFSGNGRGEPALAHLINQIEGTSMIILDYEANANETITSSIGPFIEILREKHPGIPILIMSKTRYTSAQEGTPVFELLMSNRDFQKDLVAKRRSGGDKNIHFMDGSLIYGEDYYECTVDGSHPNDLGSYRIANALISKIKEILKK